MHHLLGAVHEASVQLSELPIGDVTAALLQVLQEGGEDVSALNLASLILWHMIQEALPSAALGGSAC